MAEKKKTARSKTTKSVKQLPAGLTDHIDAELKKLLERAWKLSKGVEQDEGNRIKLMDLMIKILDTSQMVYFKKDLFRLVGICEKTFYNYQRIFPNKAADINIRIARNKALETIRILTVLANSTNMKALVVRLKLVSQEAREVLNLGYSTTEDETNSELSLNREQKLMEITKLANSIGPALMQTIGEEVRKSEEDAG